MPIAENAQKNKPKKLSVEVKKNISQMVHRAIARQALAKGSKRASELWNRSNMIRTIPPT
jgi:hypothetical protein